MKTLLLFLAKLLLYSLLLVPLLPFFYRAYLFALALLASGRMPTLQAMGNLPYVGSRNLYTFFVLVLATPKLGMRKRVVGIAAGVALFLLIDLLMTLVWIPVFERPVPCLFNEAVSYTWYTSVRYVMPFLLWFVVAWRELGALRNEAVHVDGR